MTDVSWDPQMFSTAGSNGHDLVNLNVDATVSGATTTTDYGGGKALAGWAISVMHGDDAVDGAPDMLDDDGMASLMTTVDKADLPATFTFAVAGDQDDKLDGGEKYTPASVDYPHTGLKLAGTMDAGTMEVAYTTQTLMVYVHEERDQVTGYTGNILGGDMRDDGKVSVSIRYIDGNGRSRAFATADKISTPNNNGSKGVWTFSNVPADRNVIVQADKATGAAIKLLDDELAAYDKPGENDMGAFGEMGGFNHTVERCPLQAATPQDHDECASFAYVSTYTVSGLVWKNRVEKKGDGFDTGDDDDGITTFVAGQTVSLSPVEDKNLAGEPKSHTTTEKPVKGPGETSKGTEVLDETHQFNFGAVAAGVYKLSIPDGWRAKKGPMDATDDVGDAFDPLGADVMLDVTPATATFFGRVDGTDGFPLDSVTVTVNGMSDMTDAAGRYIIDGIAPETRKIGSTTHRNSIFVEASRAGYTVAKLDPISFGTGAETKANKTTRQDIDLAGVQSRATFSGKVIASNGGAAIANVEILVDGEAPLNKATSGANKGKLVTGGDGTFTAEAAAKTLGEIANVSARKDGWTFVPAEYPAAAHPGATTPSITFSGFVNATITGRVAKPGGGPMSGVLVTARKGTEVADTMTTGTTGSFSLSVSGVGGSYALTATLANHTFEIPAQYRQAVNVAPGQVVNIGTIQAMTFAASDVSAMRTFTADDTTTAVDESERYDGNVRVAWKAGTVPEGHVITYTAQTKVGTADWAAFGDAVTSTNLVEGAATPDWTARTAAVPAESDGGFMVRVRALSDNGTSGDDTDDVTIDSDPINVAAINPSASSVTAALEVTADTTVADTLTVTWKAKTNANSEFRILLQTEVAGLTGLQWFVVAGGTPSALANTSREWTLDFNDGTNVTWATVGGTAGVTVTPANLRAAKMIRVDSRQGATGDFTEGTAVSITKTTSGS
jgi:hypothetical protein